MLDIKIEKAATLKAKPTDESKLGFGNIFTDHMFVIMRRSSWTRPVSCSTMPRRSSRA